jgi:CheY-like chemotaxis protein
VLKFAELDDGVSSRPTPTRIVVIDDDPVFLELMHDLLGSGEGYDVHSSRRWLESFDLIKDLHPNPVILDLVMGREQHGWDVLDRMQDDPSTIRIPIILCSASAHALEQQLPRRLCETSSIATIPKPFDIEDLLQTIRRLLAEPGQPPLESDPAP